ncbi:MAG: signal recognition particle subunit SRP19/SEC65 family protein [Thermoplasmata archaeon]|nr:signal recognition particle subunit SRP19/SEC65 family protein [Thermoplasmata archaeon]
MPEHFYVYPSYLAKGGPRSLGRRVPAGIAVKDVTVEQVATAAKALGYTAEIESAKQYPRQFYQYPGRVKVTKKKGASKARVLRELAAEIERTVRAGA